MSFAEAAEQSIREAQRDLQAKPGEFWVRGVGLVLIVETDSEGLRWQTDDGEDIRGTWEAFRSRALRRAGEALETPPEYLDHVWGLASAREIDAVVRVVALGRAVRRAPDDAARTKVLGWARTLSQGMEPKR